MKPKPTTRTDRAAPPPAKAPSSLRSAGALHKHDSPERAKPPELPEGWQEVRLGDVIRTQAGNSTLIKGKLPSQPGPGLFPAYSASGQDVWAPRPEHRGDAIIVSAVGARCGKCFLAAGDWSAIANTHIVWPDTRYVDPYFLWLLLNDEKFWLRGQSAQPFVQVGATKEKKILLPPLPEQRAIAGVLRTVQRAREACERRLAATRQLKHSLLHHLFTYGPVAIHQTDQLELQQTAFGEVPATWATSLLNECAYVQTGVAKGRKLGRSEVVELPYLRVANVQDGRLDLTEIKTIQLRRNEVDRFLLQTGDVVLTEGGDFDKLGRGFIWHGQVSPCVHQNHIFAVRTNREKLLPEFFAYLVQSSYGKAYFLSVAHKTTNLACINTAKLKALPVLLPPLPEQREIAAMLGAVDGLMAALEARRAALAALFTSLLEHLMTGRLRVPLECGGKRSAPPLCLGAERPSEE